MTMPCFLFYVILTPSPKRIATASRQVIGFQNSNICKVHLTIALTLMVLGEFSCIFTLNIR